MSPRANSRAFSLIDVLIVLAVILTLALFILPNLAKSRARAFRINCSSNLKSVGLAFKMWEIDNNDRFPFHVPLTEGGAMEAANNGNLPFVFEVMSNEVSTPKILICPADVSRVAATNFLTLRNTNISYFVGLDATNTAPSAFLLGDHNITNAAGLNNGVFLADINDSAGWTVALHKNCGNIGLADGSVQQLSTARLRQAIANTGFQTNRLLMP